MDKKIKVLVGIDLQNDFIDGSLANKAAQAVIDNIVEKIRDFDGDVMFFTLDTHFSDYLQTKEGNMLPVEHCLYMSKGWDINPKVADAIHAKVEQGMKVVFIPKPTFGSVEGILSLSSSYDNKSLVEEILKLENGNESPIPMDIIMFGFCTDICVVSNAIILKAFTHDFADIYVDGTCCAGVTPQKHEAALEVMRSCQINA